MLAAMGPEYQKYVWWKQHMTTLQMVQFVGIMIHGFQLVCSLLVLSPSCPVRTITGTCAIELSAT
jgi:GNS1/SUR4 family